MKFIIAVIKPFKLDEVREALGGLGVASGTNAAFYSIINLAQAGDNIVSARNLYGGTRTRSSRTSCLL